MRQQTVATQWLTVGTPGRNGVIYLKVVCSSAGLINIKLYIEIQYQFIRPVIIIAIESQHCKFYFLLS